MSSLFNWGIIPSLYRDVFEMFNSHGLNKLTFSIFVLLFESNTLTKSLLNQVNTREKEEEEKKLHSIGLN